MSQRPAITAAQPPPGGRALFRSTPSRPTRRAQSCSAAAATTRSAALQKPGRPLTAVSQSAVHFIPRSMLCEAQH